MARCELTGKGPSVKNLVSHSNIKTKSTTRPNIQQKQLHSQALNQYFSFKVAASTIRTIENRSSLDSFLLKQCPEKLSKRAMAVRSKIRRKLAGKTSGKSAGKTGSNKAQA